MMTIIVTIILYLLPFYSLFFIITSFLQRSLSSAFHFCAFSFSIVNWFHLLECEEKFSSVLANCGGQLPR